MNKNTKTILLSLLACLLLITGFELGEGRIRFGSARLNDSTATYITTNKSFVVNGTLKATDSLVASGILSIGALEFDVSGTITFNYGSMIQEDAIDQLSTYAETHKFKTEYGTELATIDSATGVGIKINSGANFTGSLVKTKLIKGITPATTITFGNYPHGITNGRILGFTCLVKRDTIASFSYQNDPMYPPNGAIPAYSYNAYVDSINCGVYMLASATYLLGDSVFFLVQYLD